MLKDILLSSSSNLSMTDLEDNFGDYKLYGATGFIKCIDFFDKDEEYIAIVKDGAGVGKSFLCDLKSSILSTLQYLTPKNKNNLKFSYYLLYNIHFEKYKVGSTIPHIYYKDYSKEKVFIPSIEEQRKIANFLVNIDKKINLLNQKQKLLRNFKKFCLQNIFSEDEKLRFKKTNGEIFPDWNSCILDDIFRSVKGKGLSKEKLDENGKYKCILYGELYTKYDEIIKSVISKTNYDEGVLSEIGDILIPSSTTTKGIDLVNATAILEDNVRLGGDITILKKKNDNIDSKYFAYYLSYGRTKEISRLTQGSTIIHLYWEHLKKIPITVPCLKEQQKIVSNLLTIDKKLDLTQNQIENMEKFKKGLLQQMFVYLHFFMSSYMLNILWK